MNKRTLNNYHLCSEGTRHDDLFHNDEEFCIGMNIIAQATWLSGIEILAFCIMDNHFHFVVCSTLATAQEFVRKLTLLYALRRSRQFITDTSPEKLKWEYNIIGNEKYLLNSIAYVLRNPIDQYFRFTADEYRWSSASLYFKEPRTIAARTSTFRSICSLGARRCRELIGCRTTFPEDWLVTGEGYIWPGSYINYRRVEDLFRNVRSFMFFMSSTKDDEIEKILEFKQRLFLSDIELRKAALRICQEKYRANEIKDLSLPIRANVAELLVERYGASRKQICKILHLDYRGK